MTSARRNLLIAVPVLVVALVAAYLVWFRSADEPDRWKTVRYQGVRVEIPSSWHQVRANGCGFVYAQHSPRSTICALTPGLEFYGQGIFDPYRAPGLTHDVQDGRTVWLGYVTVGGTVVATSSFDRAVSKRVLGSARKAD